MAQSIKPDPEEVLKQIESDLAGIGEIPRWQRVLEFCLKILGLVSALLIGAEILKNLLTLGELITFNV
jgi:hypothetical protein